MSYKQIMKTIRNNTLTEFETEVNEYLAKGWAIINITACRSDFQTDFVAFLQRTEA